MVDLTASVAIAIAAAVNFTFAIASPHLHLHPRPLRPRLLVSVYTITCVYYLLWRAILLVAARVRYEGSAIQYIYVYLFSYVACRAELPSYISRTIFQSNVFSRKFQEEAAKVKAAAILMPFVFLSSYESLVSISLIYRLNRSSNSISISISSYQLSTLKSQASTFNSHETFNYSHSLLTLALSRFFSLVVAMSYVLSLYTRWLKISFKLILERGRERDRMRGGAR